MTGSDVVRALKKKFRAQTDSELAAKIGMTVPGLQIWKNRARITERQLGELVYKANRAGASNLQVSAIRPLVEFFPIQRTDSRQGARFELFSTKTSNGGSHDYFHGLRKELDEHCGVYIFFDSRGQAIYTGKARKQTLWREMNGAFNRDRRAVQKIKRVRHPKRNQMYQSSNEKARQITDQVVPLHEIAAYFSAYEVADGMIGELEAMLVRSFANDLLNKRMERFGHQRNR